MHQLGKLTKNFVVLDSCNDNKRLSILFYSILYACGLECTEFGLACRLIY